ncbi:hypothetical protein ACPW96_04280 [Micromonospora sp. DT81.3]|uniref:hypothetical protein n=1 Tax=Micromonospora sp. DT81.3 TaxID=3416523 RepID=UPI003CF09551
MGFLDRLFGTEQPRQQPPVPQYGQDPYAAPVSTGRPGMTPPPAGPPAGAPAEGGGTPRTEDELAIERYRYLLRTAPPETIEQVHAEAFGRLTEQQRQQVLADLSTGLSPFEQPRSTDPQALARAATRAEYMNPGFMERTLGNTQGTGRSGPGFGSMVGGSLLGTVAGYVIGSAIVSSFMGPSMYDQGYEDGSADAGADGSGDAGADASGDAGADAGSADAGSADGGGFDGGGFDGGGFDGGGFDAGGMDFGGFDGF